MIVDITAKPSTLRSARARSEVQLPRAAADCIREDRVNKGDVATAARLAGIMAVKRTWELLPHCHPLQLEHCAVDVTLCEDTLGIEVEVACIGATGVEMEALTGASVAALTAYDMLKPHCNALDMVIGPTRLLQKTGGKTDFTRQLHRPVSAAIVAIHDPRRQRLVLEERANALRQRLADSGLTPVTVVHVAGTAEALSAALDLRSEALILTLGGSGHRASDCAPEVCAARISRALPGLIAAARQHGLARTPLAALSRGTAGFTASGQLLVNLPGTQEGWIQYWSALRTPLLHLLERGG
ncbi:MAG: cyclic pyranopterin monophosphate synthase MoaC [Oceanococcaceae bacterium]